MFLRHLIRPHRFLSPLTDGEAGGAAPAAPDAAPVDSAPAAASPAEQAAPSTMLDAISRHFNRDEQGRFAPPPKDGEQQTPQTPQTPQAATQQQPTKPAAAAQQATQTPAEDDPTVMPDGLGPKAQERFQRLVTSTRELTTQLDDARRQVDYVRETFQSNAIQREQFEQFATFAGAINKGDFATAEQVLLSQLRQLSLATGKDYGQAVDPLSEFPDLKAKVDGLQISQADAMEVAKLRRNQSALQQQHQQAQQAQQSQQQAQQDFARAQSDVDAWWKQTAASDIDAPAIEAQLLPNLPNLLQGIPPQQWVRTLQTQYQILKGAASAFRQRVASQQPAPLRPTGAASPQQKPSSLYEAMWGRPQG